MRTLSIVGLFVLMVSIAAVAVADGSKTRNWLDSMRSQSQTRHHDQQSCQTQQRHREEPRRDEHRGCKPYNDHSAFLPSLLRGLGESDRYDRGYGYGYGQTGYGCGVGPASVVTTSNGVATINRGAIHGIRPGMRFVVWGQPQTDPYTRAPLPETRKILCWMTVVEVRSETAFCSIDQGYCGRSDLITPAPQVQPTGY